MRRFWPVLLLAIFPACPGPGPSPSPPPSSPPTSPSPSPTASPSPTPAPTWGYDCANPPVLTGFVRVKEPVSGRYIVVLKSPKVGVTGLARTQALQLQTAALASRFQLKNVKPFARLYAFRAEMLESKVEELTRDKAVAYVQQDGTKHIPRPMEPRKSVSVAATVTWGLDRIDQRNLPLDHVYAPGADGTGLQFYDIDTGLDATHPEFAGRVGNGWSAFGGAPTDGHGHGTHTAGTSVGKTHGVAPAATLHAVKVLDDSGSGSDSDVIGGIDWVTQQVEGLGLKHAVANMSLGGDVSPALDQAVCNSIAAGVTYAVAAGNDYGADACSGSPSRVLQAVVVGASDSVDETASFTDLGRCVDLFGPGVDVESAKVGGGFVMMSGTSMATPHVSGGALLYLQRHPSSTPADVSAGLVFAATPKALSGVPRDTANLLLFVKEP